MNYRPNYGGGGFLGDIPPAIRQLVLINVIIFLFTALLDAATERTVVNLFGLVPAHLVGKGFVWQLVTYMFLHGDVFHILFNMFMLWMFGQELERWWGFRDFLKYFFVCGIGGGILQVLSTFIFGGANSPIIGASGAVFGILIAYAMAFPNRQVLLWFVIPINVRTLIGGLIVIDLVLGFTNSGGGVARFAHLGGALVGYLYLKQDVLLRKWRQIASQSRSTGSRSRSQKDEPPSADHNAKLDAILDKLKQEGAGALTPEERAFLHESAERARRRQKGQH
ncbi:MAG: rhomboid family intramembrane serine protease [Candidatus Eisenbacteria bacterium]|uniref:Rhomboid family intramembrane serine protease n=1 Tax=Eiseniibacteriota bacterium TaxID=2212470 RepID=A0A7Y2E7G6_UNCEI|nr:rhomboid family intramembrane serine protease [Candidatus Eisenbacteria bacterium]